MKNFTFEFTTNIVVEAETKEEAESALIETLGQMLDSQERGGDSDLSMSFDYYDIGLKLVKTEKADESKNIDGAVNKLLK